MHSFARTFQLLCHCGLLCFSENHLRFFLFSDLYFMILSKNCLYSHPGLDFPLPTWDVLPPCLLREINFALYLGIVPKTPHNLICCPIANVYIWYLRGLLTLSWTKMVKQEHQGNWSCTLVWHNYSFMLLKILGVHHLKAKCQSPTADLTILWIYSSAV